MSALAGLWAKTPTQALGLAVGLASMATIALSASLGGLAAPSGAHAARIVAAVALPIIGIVAILRRSAWAGPMLAAVTTVAAALGLAHLLTGTGGSPLVAVCQSLPLAALPLTLALSGVRVPGPWWMAWQRPWRRSQPPPLTRRFYVVAADCGEGAAVVSDDLSLAGMALAGRAVDVGQVAPELRKGHKVTVVSMWRGRELVSIPGQVAWVDTQDGVCRFGLETSDLDAMQTVLNDHLSARKRRPPSWLHRLLGSMAVRRVSALAWTGAMLAFAATAGGAWA